MTDGVCGCRWGVCFIDADWPLVGGSFATADVAVLWPKKLTERLVALGLLAGAFPPA